MFVGLNLQGDRDVTGEIGAGKTEHDGAIGSLGSRSSKHELPGVGCTSGEAFERIGEETNGVWWRVSGDVTTKTPGGGADTHLDEIG